MVDCEVTYVRLEKRHSHILFLCSPAIAVVLEQRGDLLVVAFEVGGVC